MACTFRATLEPNSEKNGGMRATKRVPELSAQARPESEARGGFSKKNRCRGEASGLALAQRVAKDHGGVLQVARRETLGGARFEARWGEAR